MESNESTTLAAASPPCPALAPTGGWRRVGTPLMLGAIVLLAAVLRLHGLGHESVWFDEALSVIHVRKPFMGMLASARMLENMPPLYFCLLWVWARIAGTSDFAVRLPSAILGVGSVVMLFRLGRRLGGAADGDRLGLLAALLLAVSRYHIAYSQQARAYSLVIFLVLLSCELFLRLIGFGADPGEMAPGTGTAVAYMLFSAAMLWTQPFSGFSLVAQSGFYVVLWARWRVWPARFAAVMPVRRWATLQAEILLLFAPWLGQMREVMQIGAPWMHTPHVVAAYRDYGDSGPLLASLGVLVVLAMVRGVWRRQVWVIFGVLLCVLPVCVPVLASTAKHPLFIPRYGMAAIIGIDLLAAGGAAFLGTVGGWAAVLVVCAAAAPHLAEDFDDSRNLVDRPDVRDAAALVDQRASAGDGLVFEELLERKVFSVYSRRSDLEILPQVPAALGGGSLPRHVWYLSATDKLDTQGMWIAGTPYRISGRWEFHQAVVAELERN